jgi:hypothetical protein
VANSPDLKKYVDLTVYDEDPVELMNEILGAARGLLPNWRPEAGQIETVLSEAFAIRSASLANSINRVPAATTEVLLQLFGLTRSDGAKATATLTITFTDSDTFERTLDAGTEFLFLDAVTGISYTFALDSAFTLNGSLSGTAAVTAVDVGAAYNVAASGKSLTLISANATFFESAVFSTNASGGTDAETDDEYFDRGVNLLASYTSAATTATQIKYYVGANKTYAKRVEVFNRRRYRDRDTTADDYGTHDGAVLVAIASTVSNPASAAAEVAATSSNLADLHSSLADRTPSGLIVDVMSAELAEIDVTASVVKKSGFAGSDVSTAIETALKAYLNANTWNWSTNTVRRNEVIALIDSVDGVDYVESLTMDASTLVGSSNVGHYTSSGGSKTTVNLDITGVAPDDASTVRGSGGSDYAAGELSFYYVDADEATPVIYEFTNTGAVTITSGAANDVPFEAVANGLNYNDTANSGKVDPDVSVSLPGTGTLATTLGAATKNSSSAYTGGSNDSNTFTVLNGTGAVSDDIVLRNLGTLVTYGTLNITVT